MAEKMTRKVTILFPPALYSEVMEEVQRQGRSVGELVREAVMIRYGAGGEAARMQAVERLVRLDDEVAGPQQLEDEIMRGATGP